MNTNDIDLLLLLESSGELTPEQKTQLDEAVRLDPEVAARREDMAVLQHAGRVASGECVPAQPDIHREAILQQAGPESRRGPGPWLALAALLVIGLALWPHLPRSDSGSGPAPKPLVATDPVMEPTKEILEEDPVLAGLEDLDRALNDIRPLNVADVLEPDADFWAEQLLLTEDT